jgi:hypothetical protein
MKNTCIKLNLDKSDDLEKLLKYSKKHVDDLLKVELSCDLYDIIIDGNKLIMTNIHNLFVAIHVSKNSMNQPKYAICLDAFKINFGLPKEFIDPELCPVSELWGFTNEKTIFAPIIKKWTDSDGKPAIFINHAIMDYFELL